MSASLSLTRRRFFCALAAVLSSRRTSGQSVDERLIAAMQDGGKIIYLHRLPRGGVEEARELGRALRALRVPLNEILAGPGAQARQTADLAFGAGRVSLMLELVAHEEAADRLSARLDAVRRLLRSIPGPGMNRVVVGDRAPLAMAAERRFPDSVLPEGAMAIFLPGTHIELLGTVTAARVIAAAKVRGAM